MQNRWFWLPVLILATGLMLPPPEPASAVQEPLQVGRIAYIEGSILRYVPDLHDWAATIMNAPFGMGDAFYSDIKARGEFVLPDFFWARIGGGTQIQLIALKGDASEIDIAAGVARLHNKGSRGVLKTTTPFGYVLADGECTFDLYVGDQSLEVVPLNGEVTFISPAASSRATVVAGSGSIRADGKQMESADAEVDEEWHNWNMHRDEEWSRIVARGASTVRNVPPQLRDDAYILEENGRWERLYYDGGYHELWRPSNVPPSWQPFTMGRWTEWRGDQCWIPDEPFGYVTHHYGNWIPINAGWYWVPPATSATVPGDPCWYPGRVAWIYNEADIGWIPLAPAEIYYAHNRWGPRAAMVDKASGAAIGVGNLAFHRTAVVVPQRELYSVPNYASVKVTNISPTSITNNYRLATVVNDSVIGNYSQAPNRLNFTNAAIPVKPHPEVAERVQLNKPPPPGDSQAVSAVSLRQAINDAKPIEPLKSASVPSPKITGKMVPLTTVNGPKSQEASQVLDLEKSTRPATASSGAVPTPGGPALQHPTVGTNSEQAVRSTGPTYNQSFTLPQASGAQGGRPVPTTPVPGPNAPGAYQPHLPGAQISGTDHRTGSPGGQLPQSVGPGMPQPGKPVQPQPGTMPSNSVELTLLPPASEKPTGFQGSPLPAALNPGAQSSSPPMPGPGIHGQSDPATGAPGSGAHSPAVSNPGMPGPATHGPGASGARMHGPAVSGPGKSAPTVSGPGMRNPGESGGSFPAQEQPGVGRPGTPSSTRAQTGTGKPGGNDPIHAGPSSGKPSPATPPSPQQPEAGMSGSQTPPKGKLPDTGGQTPSTPKQSKTGHPPAPPGQQPGVNKPGAPPKAGAPPAATKPRQQQPAQQTPPVVPPQ